MEDRTGARLSESLKTQIDAVRSALLDIVSPSAPRWTKADIGTWLSGSYRTATRSAPESVNRPATLAPYTHRAQRSSIDDGLHFVVSNARHVAMAAIRQAAAGEFEFAVAALEAGHIEQVSDGEGGFAFVPVDNARMSLADRIVSLLAADYLTRSEDYESNAVVCGCCDRVVFDADARECGRCCAAPRSGIRFHVVEYPESCDETLVGLGRVAG